MRRVQPGADPLQAILGGLYRVRCRFEHTAQNLFMVTAVLVHASFSSTLCSADMARAMWLLTAPVLISIVEAI